MNMCIAGILAHVLAGCVLSGCAIGYDSLLFVTKSNVGLDVDTTPPTAEVSIARRESAIAPTFEKGQTPPVLASFRVGFRGILGVWADVASAFAGGDAAATMALLFDQPDATTAENASLCLQEKPRPIGVFGQELKFPGPGDVRPFLFGTDTSLGLKVAWSGLTATVPDTVKLGYNRKELATAPIFAIPEACGTMGGQYVVRAPSFLATIGSSPKVAGVADSELQYVQYFATGRAATSLSLRQDVRTVMIRRLNPDLAVQFESFRDHQQLQQDSVRRIQQAYDAQTDAKKSAIREEAIRLKLVQDNMRAANDVDFKHALSRAVNGNDQTVTTRLSALEKSI